MKQNELGKILALKEEYEKESKYLWSEYDRNLLSNKRLEYLNRAEVYDRVVKDLEELLK